jgi:hypothetical protein
MIGLLGEIVPNQPTKVFDDSKPSAYCDLIDIPPIPTGSVLYAIYYEGCDVGRENLYYVDVNTGSRKPVCGMTVDGTNYLKHTTALLADPINNHLIVANDGPAYVMGGLYAINPTAKTTSTIGNADMVYSSAGLAYSGGVLYGASEFQWYSVDDSTGSYTLLAETTNYHIHQITAGRNDEIHVLFEDLSSMEVKLATFTPDILSDPFAAPENWNSQAIHDDQGRDGSGVQSFVFDDNTGMLLACFAGGALYDLDPVSGLMNLRVSLSHSCPRSMTFFG